MPRSKTASQKAGELARFTGSEAQIQSTFFQWCALVSGSADGHLPEMALAYHIPNGGSRSRVEGARFKAQGVRAGVPDVHLPVPRGGYASLYIEFKRPGGRLRATQRHWCDRLTTAGNKVEVCTSVAAAVDCCESYLAQPEFGK